MAIERTQLMAPVVASATAVHAAVALLAAAQTVTGVITHPACYRAVSVKGNQAGIAGNVIVTGTDWNGDTITDTIALSGASTVAGVRPFKTVTSITLPALTGAGDTVSVGIADVFGLYGSITASADVMLQERAASGATEFTIEAVGTVNTTYDTVATAITAGDRIRWTYLDSGVAVADTVRVSLEEAKAWIGEDTAYADDQITAIVDGAIAAINRAVDTFAGADEVYDGKGCDTLFIGGHIFYDVAAITVDGETVTDWELERPWLLYRLAGWPSGRRNIVVSYVPTNSLPHDLRLACLMLVKFYASSQLTARSMFFEGGGGIGQEREWPNQVKMIVESYRKPGIA